MEWCANMMHLGVFHVLTDVFGMEFILNIRRSPQMSEPFEFDVAYETSFEQIEALRGRMIAFLSNERRDYIATFDVAVVGALERPSEITANDMGH
jgi:small-conductance mechanosensitive channel